MTFDGPFGSYKTEAPVPLKPIWAGFVFNSLLYAGVLSFLFIGPMSLRRRLRLRYGQCVRCGYDLRGTPPDHAVCSECGWET